MMEADDQNTWINSSDGPSTEFHPESVFDHLERIKALLLRYLEKSGLVHCLVENAAFEVDCAGAYSPDGLNNYYCTMRVNPGLGIVQPLVSVITLGEGLYVETGMIAAAIATETLQLVARREEIAAAREAIRDVTVAAIETAATEGLSWELLSIEAARYEAEYQPPERRPMFRVEITMLRDRCGQVERDRWPIDASDPSELATLFRDVILPEQHEFRRRLTGDRQMGR